MLKCPKCGGDSHIRSLNDDFDNLYTCSVCRNTFNPPKPLKETKMTQSNSKLSREEKLILKDMRADSNLNVVTNNEDTVIVYEIVGNVAKFSTSIMSQDENKFRFKVGEYRARCRFEDMAFAMLPVGGFEDFLDTHDYFPRDHFRNL